MTMPHVNSGGTDDFYSSDEVKVYQHEGEEENEKRSSENLSEDKLGLVTETEEDRHKQDRQSDDVKPPSPGERDGPFGSYVPNYPPFQNGSTPTSIPPGIYPPYFCFLQGGKVPMLQSPLGVLMPGYGSNESPFTSPPPAHMGIPPVTIDPKTGLPRHVYPYSSAPGQFPPLYADQWQRPPGYPITSGALGGHYPPSFISSSGRYPHGLFPHGVHPGMPYPGMVPGPKQEGGMPDNHRYEGGGNQSPQPEKKKTHIKKPLNAFMLFMKEQRAKVVAECTLKESAAINQILGRRWHSLDRQEQSKYYEMARKEKELHLQLYPGWSARDNYATHNKKKKRKKLEMLGQGEKGMGPDERFVNNPAFGECSSNSKKCRARYGMDQQKNWCKPCRRKKKCIRVYEGYTDGEEDNGSDSVPDSDSIMGSPAHSSASEDLLCTPHKGRIIPRDSPLVLESSQDFSEFDTNLKSHSDILPGLRSPYSPQSPFSRSGKMEKSMTNEFSVVGVNTSHLSSPLNFSKLPGLSRSYSIDSLAKSAVNSDRETNSRDDKSYDDRYNDNCLSPLSSGAGDIPSSSFSISTFSEDLNSNISPKKPLGLNSSFSISSLSVSAVTPSRLSCS